MNNKKFLTGFTLIEMLVALAIFGLLAGAFAGFLLNAIQAQRRILANQELLNNGSYILEYMSRAIRMAKKDVENKCGLAGQNYQITDNTSLKFLNYHGECQEFFLENNILKEWKKIGDSEFIYALTPAEVEVSGFKVSVEGDAEGQQPKVTINLEMKSQKGPLEPEPSLILKTSISQRDLNVSY